MAYAVAWNEATPAGASVDAATLDTELQDLKKSIRERMNDILSNEWETDADDPKVLIGGSGITYKDETLQATTGTTSESLGSVTIPADRLAANGDFFTCRLLYTTAANANSKSIEIFFGGSSLGTASTTTSSAKFLVVLTVYRRGASSQYYSWSRIVGTTANITEGTLSLDLTTALLLDAKGTSPSSAGEITLQTMHVAYDI